MNGYVFVRSAEVKDAIKDFCLKNNVILNIMSVFNIQKEERWVCCYKADPFLSKQIKAIADS